MHEGTSVGGLMVAVGLRRAVFLTVEFRALAVMTLLRCMLLHYCTWVSGFGRPSLRYIIIMLNNGEVLQVCEIVFDSSATIVTIGSQCMMKLSSKLHQIPVSDIWKQTGIDLIGPLPESCRQW